MFSNNLKYLRNKHAMEQVELAQKLGRKSGSSVSEWEKGTYTPKIKVLAEIADIFNVDLDDLMNKDLSSELKNSSTLTLITETSAKLNEDRKLVVLNTAEQQLEEQLEAQNKIVHINEVRELYEDYRTKLTEIDLYGSASAGTGIDLFDEVVETILYPEPVPTHDIALYVKGDSMAPLFQDGEVIFIRKTTNINSGQIGIFIVNGQGFVKKLYKGMDEVKLISLNPKYEDIVLTEHDHVVTVGLVIL